MQRIVLLSDTHGYIDDAICRYAESADEIWHAGDIGNLEVVHRLSAIKPFKAVQGNIDGKEIQNKFPSDLRFQCEKKTIWITHIGGYPPKYTPRVRKELEKEPPGIFICGHSHFLKVIYDTTLNLLYLNPGAAGNEGFHKVRTMLRFIIDGNTIKDMEIIELGKRGLSNN